MKTPHRPSPRWLQTIAWTPVVIAWGLAPMVAAQPATTATIPTIPTPPTAVSIATPVTAPAVVAIAKSSSNENADSTASSKLTWEDAAAGTRDTVSTALRHAEAAINRAAQVGKTVAVAFGPGGMARTLVIPGDRLKPDAENEVREDLAVMNRILAKTVRSEGEDQNFAFAFEGWNWKGRGGTEAFYLDGFGALFLLSVDYPLAAPPKERAEKRTARDDTTWDDARRELQGDSDSEAPILVGPLSREGAEFRQTRVDELRDELIAALKHASNIRGLDGEETVAVAVFGPTAWSVSHGEVRLQRQPQGVRALRWSDASAGGTVMTLRVKKADVDSFALGKLDQAQFAQRVSVSVR